MPALPTLTVTQAQADRMIAAYGSVTAYKQWLRESIAAFVAHRETQATLDQINASYVQADSSRKTTYDSIITDIANS